MKTKLKLMALAALLASVAAVAIAEQNTNTQQTTLNYDATNNRIGVNTSAPRASLEVSQTLGGGTFLLAPSLITPTATVTGTIAMNNSNTLAVISNTQTGLWVRLNSPTQSVTFVPAN